MKRKDIASEYKWHLEHLFESDAVWEAEFKAFSARIKKLGDYRGKLNDADKVFGCLTLSDELDVSLERLYTYARMRRDEDGLVEKYAAMADRAGAVMSAYAETASFLSPELSGQDEAFLRGLILEERFKPFAYYLSELIRGKAHILSEREERILALSGRPLSMFQDIYGKFDYIDIKFPKIRMENERVQLTHGTYSVMLQSRDESVRKNAFKGMFKAYESMINTVGDVYAGSVKADNFYAKARGYKNALSKALYNENIPDTVYEQLIAAVSRSLPAVHDYVRLRKRVLGFDSLHMYDLYMPIVAGAELKLDYPEAYALVKEGLSPLGDEYQRLLNEAYTDGWIDVYENENKRSGAYSWGAYGTHPYVLLNHNKTTNSVFTIAHELGHAMHSYFSDRALPHASAQYTIFVAEVASTVNEVLLLKHLLKTTKDDTLKKYLLSYYLDMFRTTLYRQAMFAEFEKNAHEMDDKGKPLTPKALSDMYYRLNKKYYGDGVRHDSPIRYEWARIPHFYNAFYVYKYATGLTAAVQIAHAILSDGAPAVERYMRFLHSGGSDSPYVLLKNAGVDLATEAPYRVATDEFNSTLTALKELC